MKQFIISSINILKEKRPIFHSEDDFKFSFAIVLQEELGDDFFIRLERPEEIEMIYRDGSKKEKPVRAPIDLMVYDKVNGLRYPIELKYKTKKCEYKDGDEEYKLADHGATDKGRFSFRKDIYRLEQLLSEDTPKGFFIVITNDEKYLCDVSDNSILDKHYSFHNNAILSKKDLGWNIDEDKLHKLGYILNDEKQYVKGNKIHDTSKGESHYQLDLKNEYIVKWEKYSTLDPKIIQRGKGEFYFSLLCV